MRAACLALIVCLLTAEPTRAQQPDQVPAAVALQNSLKLSALAQASQPFHAVMQIAGPTAAYTGTIDLTWLAKDHYRLAVASPTFSQIRIVDQGTVTEQDTGDYLPRWLETFTVALVDIAQLTANFEHASGSIAVGPSVTSSCLRRDDRPNNITDQLTWGVLCFTGPQFKSIQTFNVYLVLSDFKPFGDQQIARTYVTDVLDYKPVTGYLTTLEPLAPGTTFPPQTQANVSLPIKTTFVSTPQEESLVDYKPQILWPTVREGKTEGYMIVYARTDRTGQVRETAKHNSDNPGLEQFGTEQALHYKFRPLIVDGVAQQMEMPLVLHFASSLADQIPLLNNPQTRALISGCDVPSPRPGQPPIRVRISVNEAGKLTGISFPDANNPSAPKPTRSTAPLQRCTFAPYLVNGKPTYYHGDLLLP